MGRMAPKIRADGANAWGSHGERSSGEVEETDASGRHRFSSANPYLQLPRPGTSVAGRVLGLAAACALVGAVPLGGGGDQDACRSPVNNIVAENCLPGAPSTEWDVNGAGDWSIQGFASDISFVEGDTALFFVKTASPQWRLDIYRMGFYSGSGARHVATVRPHVPLPQVQPECTVDDSTLLYECSNWRESARWHIGHGAVSGLYFARAVREDAEDEGGRNWRRDNSKYRADYKHFVEGTNASEPPLHGAPEHIKRHAYGVNGMGRMRNALKEPRASHIFFVIRDDARKHDMLVQTADTTWQAYNGYGGFTTYGSFDHPYTHGPDVRLDEAALIPGQAPRRAFKASYARPLVTRDYRPVNMPFNAEYPLIRFLESMGYDVAYTTGVDSSRRGELIKNCRVFVSVGHDEYWSGEQRRHVEAARDTGVHLMFLAGNNVYWKIRWESDFRTMVVYKESQSTQKIDPNSTTWTGTFRDARAINPEGAWPENSLLGSIFTVNAQREDALVVPHAFKGLRLWRHTALAEQAAAPVSHPYVSTKGVLGHEWNEDLDNSFRPAGLIRLSRTLVDSVQYLMDHGGTFDAGSACHHVTLYKAPSSALVFSAGTVQWAWGLDAHHDIDDPPRKNKHSIRVMTDVQGADRVVQQATVNMLADMMVQPAALVGDLQRARASTDASAPWCEITALVTPWQSDGMWTVSGAAGESTGGAADEGRVAGVEVSLDGGQRWHPADALEGLDQGPGAWKFVCGDEAWHGFYDDMCGDGWKTKVISARAKLMLLTQVLCRAVDDSLNIGAVASAAASADAGRLSQRSEL